MRADNRKIRRCVHWALIARVLRSFLLGQRSFAKAREAARSKAIRRDTIAI